MKNNACHGEHPALDGVDDIPLKVSILGDEGEVRIEIQDPASRVMFLELRLTPEDFCAAAMGRLSGVNAAATVRSLRKVGLTTEHQPLEFQIPDTDYAARAAVACELADKHCPDGWVASHYFGSQGSFFRRDGESWARTTIRRWLLQEATEDQGVSE